jgi:hypothetical protein
MIGKNEKKTESGNQKPEAGSQKPRRESEEGTVDRMRSRRIPR